MSTVQEIWAAIEKLPQMERFELLNRINFEHNDLSEKEEAEILAEAEEGEREIKEGKGIPLEELRKQTHTWISK